MRKNFGSKPWIYPEPVLIIGTYDENNKPNAMNAAWGGIYDYDKLEINLSEHKTTENLRINKAFTVSIATLSTVTVSDFVGIVSGSDDPDKMKKANLHDVKSEFVNAPVFVEYPLTFECEMVSLGEDLRLVGKIINVSADESILTNGKIDPSKLEAISFDPVNNKYLLVKEVVGNAFKDGLKLK